MCIHPLLSGYLLQCCFRALVGEIDEDVEVMIDYENLKAPPLLAVSH